MIEIIIGVISAIVLGLVGMLGVVTKQRNNARADRDAAQKDAETVTELNNVQSDLRRAQDEAREKANEQKPVNRPDPDTDFNSL